jgi:phosphohistidine phosphatase
MSTTKTLFVLRHAKSAWDDVNKSDFDRPLTFKGISDATKLAGHLKNELKEIELVISSSANRAAHTATIFCSTVGVPLDSIVLNNSFYETSVSEVLHIVRTISNDIKCAMLVGHNPTFTSLVNQFLPQSIDNLPTSGLVRLDFNIESWSEIRKENLQSSWVDFPKNH